MRRIAPLRVHKIADQLLGRPADSDVSVQYSHSVHASSLLALPSARLRHGVRLPSDDGARLGDALQVLPWGRFLFGEGQRSSHSSAHCRMLRSLAHRIPGGGRGDASCAVCTPLSLPECVFFASCIPCIKLWAVVGGRRPHSTRADVAGSTFAHAAATAATTMLPMHEAHTPAGATPREASLGGRPNVRRSEGRIRPRRLEVS